MSSSKNEAARPKQAEDLCDEQAHRSVSHGEHGPKIRWQTEAEVIPQTNGQADPKTKNKMDPTPTTQTLNRVVMIERPPTGSVVWIMPSEMAVEKEATLAAKINTQEVFSLTPEGLTLASTFDSVTPST